MLMSWAVPRGPSENPEDKRLAVHVEDHPIDYGGFEGTIPKGEYGGGTVMLWDRGTWEPHGDVEEELKKGKLAFDLHGQRLRGCWALIRLRARSKNDKENWLLIKERDELAAKRRRGGRGIDQRRLAAAAWRRSRLARRSGTATGGRMALRGRQPGPRQVCVQICVQICVEVCVRSRRRRPGAQKKTQAPSSRHS